MLNLNYNVPQDVPRNVPQKKMAMTLGISSKTVKRHIKDIGIVRFIGRGSNGHWEIIDD